MPPGISRHEFAKFWTFVPMEGKSDSIYFAKRYTQRRRRYIYRGEEDIYIEKLDRSANTTVFFKIKVDKC
jgi:hypothetical protein